MFANFSVAAAKPKRVDPKDIPPPTQINLPRYQPFAQDSALVDPSESLGELLKNSGRSTSFFGSIGLTALGLDLKLDAPLQDLLPDPSYVPDFARWDSLTSDQARDENEASRRILRTGAKSPGCQVYVERRKELSISNEDSFRTVRRVAPPKGQQQPRLGNAYEFYRTLEILTSFWDDPAERPSLPPSPELGPSETAPSDGAPTTLDMDTGSQRTSTGSAMPPEFRSNLITAFIKLVSYDFGSNVSMSRTEPRLQLSSPLKHPHPRKTYIASHCSFLFQSPTTREAARAGVVHGPLAAVATRHTTLFDTPSVEESQSLDLAREVVAALITAQHRAREGKEERRFGEGEWWTSKARWGGGSGGPIGREIDKFADSIQGDKDSPSQVDAEGVQVPASKKARKGMSIYDNYRMVRPPGFTWDRRAKYEAIGKMKGTNYDDVFIVSCVFHHVSFLRVRVPQRLLEVLEGAPEPDKERRSWGTVPAWRSKWFDLFVVEERVEGMRCLWAVLAWLMRARNDGDTPMANA